MDNDVLLPNGAFESLVFHHESTSRGTVSHESAVLTWNNGGDPTTTAVEGSMLGRAIGQFRIEFLDRVVPRAFCGLPNTLVRGDCSGDDPAWSDDD